MRRLRAFLLALTVAAGLCGCGRKPLQDNGKLRVVCTLFPYYDFVRQIGGDDVDVTLVVPAGRETHSFEPTPLDVIPSARRTCSSTTAARASRGWRTFWTPQGKISVCPVDDGGGGTA